VDRVRIREVKSRDREKQEASRRGAKSAVAAGGIAGVDAMNSAGAVDVMMRRVARAGVNIGLSRAGSIRRRQ
jgi:hypothetical protein